MQSSSMERSFELLDSVADLHLGNNSMDEWLVRLAKMTNSAGAYCINWKTGNHREATRNGSDKKYLFTSDWLSSIDDMISQSGLGETGILDEALQTIDLSNLSTKNPLQDRNLMLGYLKSEPICTLVVLRCDDRPEGWTETDRGYFKNFLPVLLKAHLVHKKIVSTESYLNIADKVLNTSPRGIITFTPSARIIQANKMAHDLMDGNSSFIEEDGKLLVTEPTIATQLEAKLAEIKATPINSLKDFVWNRSFLNEKDNRTFQIAMHANPIDNWHLETGVDDRFIVMFINELGAESKPSSQQLQDFYDLTAAQARLVASLLDGNNIKAAAKELKLSIHTVRSHLRSIYKRLGVENNADLLRHISSTLVNYRSE
jgi:DNA-binding CsgD family transcriptional regulator